MNSTKILVKLGTALMMVLFFLTDGQAQEPVYSQYFNNPIHYNPAMIGANPGLHARMQYRDHWRKLNSPIQNYNFSVDIAERNIPGSGGFGLIVNRENLGNSLIERTNVGFGTSVRLRIHKDFIAQLGVMGNYVQRELTGNYIYTPQLHELYGYRPDNVIIPEDYQNKNYADMKVGGIFRYHGETYGGDQIVATFGGAVHHVFKPNVSYIGLTSNMPRNYVAHVDVLIDKNGSRGHVSGNSPHIKINPGFIFEAQNAEFLNFMGGVNVMRSNIYLGLWYRSTRYANYFESNDLIFMTGVHTYFADNSKIKFMYSFDYGLSNLQSDMGSTHEFAVIIEFDDLFIFGGRDRRIIGGRKTTKNVAPLECSPF